MDLKPKVLLRRVLDFARAELERRTRPHAEAESWFDRDSEASAHDVHAAEVHEAHVAEAHEEPRELAVKADHVPRDVRTPLEVTRTEDGRLRAEWALSREDIERTERIAGERAILCLRVVSFEGGRDDVKREVLDRPSVEPTGTCDLGPSNVRGVVAIGLRTGERFVSIAHHIV